MKRKVFVFMLVLIVLLSQNNVFFTDTFFEEDRMPNFEGIGRDQGLKDLSVSSIVQDKNGFIWFGTQGGLFRYNGKDSVGYRNNPFDTKGLIHNLIQTMFYDEVKHEIWLGTYQGISKLDIENKEFTNYTVEDHGLSNNVVVAIGKDKDDVFWFGTMDGLNKFDSETGKFITYPVAGKVVRSIFLDSRDRLLVGTYEGLFYYDEVKDQLTKAEMSYPSSYVMSIKEFDQGTLSLGLWDGGVLEVDLDFNFIRHHNFQDNRVYAIEKTEDQTLWVGTWGGGLFSEKDDRIYHFPGTGKQGDIGHSVVYAMTQDQSGILWIGTNGNGVYKTNPRKINYLEFSNDPDDPTTLDAGKINTIYKDSKDRLWIAVYNKGLNLYDETTASMIKYNSFNTDSRRLENDQIMKIIEYNGALLVASGTGIERYNAEIDSFIETSIVPKGTITYALNVDAQNHLWVGTYLDGVYEYDQDFNEINHFNVDSTSNKLTDNLVYSIVNDKKGHIWIGTNNGLNVYNPKENVMKYYFKKEGDHSALASNTVRAIFEDTVGNIWIGMVGGGISRYLEETDTFKSFTEMNGLIDNTAISIKASNDGRIWIATHNGISIMDSKTEKIINLSLADGIGGYMFTGDGFVDRAGYLYFGGTHGITKFSPVTEIVSDKMPPVYITNISIYNTPIDESIEIFNNHNYVLKSNENYISFDFNALDYETLSQIQYSYKLSGVDEDWVESGDRSYASYSNLKFGNYQFSVRVKTIQGEYTEPEIVTFTIERPWYNTLYAYILYTAMFLFLLFSIYKIKENQMISVRNMELARLNDKLEEANSELEKVSIKDALTGIYNRRYFNMVLKDYLELAKRSNNYISLLMIDVDDFKKINDEYGHIFGDYFLMAFAKQIQEIIPRSTDFCARFGGDEFAVVLNDTDQEGAKIVADKLFESVHRINVEFQGKTVVVKPLVCIGVYSLKPEEYVSMDAFISSADEALYEAKRTGKNKIVIKV
ncbi:ligand-binding sensor domain-containing protein [Fusibacter ferrireducens]|uniref:Diguanylate cyclase n=1 Tax=Fusibacter ferrireducens TaxID=2785058 RepID=A0ABR9ZSM7_9FIRM|nr:ligand-binding sensor domain-containing diguanylate cyclase [Fusibacter ferrireducens]MBF4693475.1 diguanylate cyclase [Fusibacter ferrireducens]